MTEPLCPPVFKLDKYGDYCCEIILWNRTSSLCISAPEGLNNEGCRAVEQVLQALEEKRGEIIGFALSEIDFPDSFNEYLAAETAKRGYLELYDGTKLSVPITSEQIEAAVFARFVNIWLENGKVGSYMLDLDSSPDYFGGHLLNVEFEADGSMSFGGMNG